MLLEILYKLTEKSYYDIRSPSGNGEPEVYYMIDLYFDDKFANLYEKIENGKAETFKFKCEYGEVAHHFIKREIPLAVEGEKYYDLITPYGYGGPVIISASPNKKRELVWKFGEKFSQYCKSNNIVSEFVRFHPIVKNADDFTEIYKPDFDRKTPATDLKKFNDPVQEEFSKSCRKNIRQTMNKGVTYRITERPNDLSIFIPIYYSTMDRDNATEFYYFKKDYFDSLINDFRDEILLVEALFEGKTIAAAICFASGEVIHMHLSGTLQEYLYLSPAYVMRYAVTIWGKEHGYSYVFHGGGTSNSENNSLYKFKKQFARNTEFDFYVGRKIWNQEIYDDLVKQTLTEESNFFPAYRDTKC